MKCLWRLIYRFYPPFLRFLEKIRFHRKRQEFHLGFLNPQYTFEDLEKFLQAQGFDRAILAWRDPGEILSVRKIEKEVFQYHLRLFEDGEIRGHYEYSPEGSPRKHIGETVFEERKQYFQKLLAIFLK